MRAWRPLRGARYPRSEADVLVGGQIGRDVAGLPRSPADTR
jgi:hypothetical protein